MAGAAPGRHTTGGKRTVKGDLPAMAEEGLGGACALIHGTDNVELQVIRALGPLHFPKGFTVLFPM